MCESEFEYEIYSCDCCAVSYVFITDLDRGEKSVTNDAENVIQYLSAKEKINFDSSKVVYRDSTGTWDGMKISDGKFSGFYSIGVKSKEEVFDFFRRKLK